MVTTHVLHADRTVAYPAYRRMEAVWNCTQVYADKLKEMFPEDKFAIVCRGTSGLVLGTALQSILRDAPLVYLRKECERQNSHNDNITDHEPEDIEGRRIVIIDDFIAAGKTMSSIKEDFVAEYGLDPLVGAVFCLCNSESFATRVLDRHYPFKRYQILIQCLY